VLGGSSRTNADTAEMLMLDLVTVSKLGRSETVGEGPGAHWGFFRAAARR
jgi:hypothetical protein